MSKIFLTGMLVTLLLSACDGTSRQKAADKTSGSSSTVVEQPAPEVAIQPAPSGEGGMDLTITPTMMEEVMDLSGQQAVDQDAISAQQNGIKLEPKKTEKRVKLKGEVYIDDAPIDYKQAIESGKIIDSIEGGKIEVELKFKE